MQTVKLTYDIDAALAKMTAIAGYDEYGYDVNGFDADGYDSKGYDSKGYNKKGVHWNVAAANVVDDADDYPQF